MCVYLGRGGGGDDIYESNWMLPHSPSSILSSL